jgi:hypothetical protein
MLAAVLVTSLSIAPLAAAQESAPRQTSMPITAAVRNSVLTPSMPAQSGSKKGTWIGALIGAGGAAAVTYWAANQYGENESGDFCGQCFAQWGAFAIPAGALVGAIVGWNVSRSVGPQPVTARPPRTTVVAPVVARRGGGVVVSVRY